MEDNMNHSKELKYRCCDELELKYDPTKRDTLSKHDHMFQIAFRTGEIWDLQEKIFQMWLKFDTLGQKKQASPVKLKGPKSKPAKQTKVLKKVSRDLNVGYWRAMQGLPNNETIKRLLMRVVNRMISLEQMYHEGEKIKKVAVSYT